MIADAGERRSRKKNTHNQVTRSQPRIRSSSAGHSAWDRHQQYVERYLGHYDRSGRGLEVKLQLLRAGDRNDWDVLRSGHRFLRTQQRAGESSNSSTYDDEVAKKYYESLFKDYVIADLKHYKRGDIALRWRAEEDVIGGVGQFTCANKRCTHHCSLQSSVKLAAYEVNFAYSEPVSSGGGSSEAVQKNALVKVIVCPRCARKLSYARSDGRREASPLPSRSRSRSPKAK